MNHSVSIEQLLDKVESLLPELPEADGTGAGAAHASAETHADGGPPTTREAVSELFRRQLGVLGDVQLEVSVELGRTSMYLEDVARLRRGSVVVLDRYVGEPVDVLVNGRIIARGELMVVDGNFSVRLTEFV